MSPPRGLDPRRFLARHWQKRPLCLRGAFPGFRDPLTPDELAGLACEPEVESRLVLQRGGRRPWQVLPGPQNARRLRRLPRTHWTLLVQEVNKHLPAVAALLEHFDFVPHWRVDDVMVSFAPRHGSVGPHLDSYDVFLIQGRGRRRWQVDTRAPADSREGLDLRILKRFRAEASWVLGPGDVLYVPPGCAHHGVALTDSLCYSVGFRAPSHAEVLLAFLQRVVNAAPAESRYADPDLRLQRHPGEITADALRRLRGVVEGQSRGVLRQDLARLAGELLTEPKGLPPRPRARRLRPDDLARRLRAGLGLQRAQTSRLAFARQGRRTLLFVDGRTFELEPGLAFAAPLLTDSARVPSGKLRARLGRPAFLALLCQLLNAGALEWDSTGRAPGPSGA